MTLDHDDHDEILLAAGIEPSQCEVRADAAPIDSRPAILSGALYPLSEQRVPFIVKGWQTPDDEWIAVATLSRNYALLAAELDETDRERLRAENSALNSYGRTDAAPVGQEAVIEQAAAHPLDPPPPEPAPVANSALVEGEALDPGIAALDPELRKELGI